MSADRRSEGLREIASCYSALWRALSHDGNTRREPGEVRLLTDRVRDALDRRQARPENADVTFIANSFLLEDLIYQGSSVQVHRIRHRDLQTLYALKTLCPEHADNVVARDLLLREARLSMMLRHRHILAAHIVLRLPDGRPALVLGWMPNKLSDRLNAGMFSLRDILDVTAAVLSGLETVHAAGLVHADISPDNLLLAGLDLADVTIADFGITIEKGRRHADLGLAAAGHTEFAAPEQSAGCPLDDRSDLYACGRILMLMLERCPDKGDAVDRLSALAQRLTEPNPDSRPGNASATLELLSRIET
jgi:type VI secretion system protein ImpN